MPKASRRTSGSTASANRKEPYTKTSPKSHSTPDKENVDPQTKSKAKAKAKPKPKSSKVHVPPTEDYRDIELEEILDEVPCYDNAATVRRKLAKLLSDKSIIPGTNNKKWSQASMASEMQELEARDGAVTYNKNAVNGPTTACLAGFLKKSGNMGGGDSPCYYWGSVLLEKLRIYNGEKKSKTRVQAEEE